MLYLITSYTIWKGSGMFSLIILKFPMRNCLFGKAPIINHSQKWISIFNRPTHSSSIKFFIWKLVALLEFPKAQ